MSVEITAPAAPLGNAAMPVARPAALGADGDTARARPGATARAMLAPGTTALDNPARLDELESELARLIEHDCAARLPGSPAGAIGPDGSEPHVASLEPDIRDDLDVDEAEVTIIRLAEPARDGAIRASVPPATTLATRPPGASPRSPTLAQETLAAVKDADAGADSDADTPAADVEEADVEIVVPSRGGAPTGPRGPASRRDPD